jgi:cell pole-organizing protein PopZ
LAALAELPMSNPQHEPTMEEILASIRKIISEDAPEGGAPVAEAAPAPPPPPAQPQAAPAPAHDDILELTQEVEIVSPDPSPVLTPAEDIVFENVAPSSEHSDIFSDQTRKAMEDAFNSIPEDEPEPAAPVRRTAPIAPVDGASVESVFERAVRESFEPVVQKYLSDNSSAVIEAMKPLIREWMDEHFPPLLEGAVRAEVERVVKSRGKR